MNQELKQKAFELLIDKIDVNTFERYLYQFVKDNELDSKSILFDFIEINYKSERWKKDLENLILDSFPKEELLSYQIYNLCLKISETKNTGVILNSLNELSSLYSEHDFDYDILYNFYIYNARGGLLEIGYHFSEEEDIISNTTKDVFKVLDLFKMYRYEGNWNRFLNEVLNKEPISVFYPGKTEKLKRSSAMLSSSSSSEKERDMFERILDFFKGVLGLR
ncbi:hypothetical protein [Tenacibaculum sp. 190524A05c]|uniref:hypothetical protein n=1 Tax=Tenacibaculum platacis TaxID=3137852 RepID=UPI0031FA573F